MPRMTPEQLAKLPTTRDAATEAGSTYYFTGEPCKRGHTTYRYTVNNACAECTNRFIAKSRVTGVPCAFRIRNRDHLFAADPQLSTKIGIILLNDEKLCDWLIARAQAGEQGIWESKLRFEAGALPLRAEQIKLTTKAPGDSCLMDFMQNGWTPDQLVREGYAELREV